MVTYFRLKNFFCLLLQNPNKMVVRIPLNVFSHQRKIANLYKKWVRRLEDQSTDRAKFRYEATLARAEFDIIYYEKDLRKAKKMLLEKEEELHTKFFVTPYVSPSSPEGVDYQRHIVFEDWFLDFWHPFEKAVYPKYFAKRELRKQQFLEHWNKIHGPPKPEDFH